MCRYVNSIINHIHSYRHKNLQRFMVCSYRTAYFRDRLMLYLYGYKTINGGVNMALEVVVLDKDEYKALIDNQADEDELEYLKACQYALESFNKVRGLCPKCKKSVVIDGWVCPCCGYDSSGEELYKYGD